MHVRCTKPHTRGDDEKVSVRPMIRVIICARKKFDCALD